jgi:hypothetical protein
MDDKATEDATSVAFRSLFIFLSSLKIKQSILTASLNHTEQLLIVNNLSNN